MLNAEAVPATDKAAVTGKAAAPGCGICGARALTPWLTAARDYVTGDEFSVWRCGVCDVAETAPRPRTLDRYYPPRYRRYTRTTVSLLRALYRRRAGAWIGRLGEPGILLEVGCGEGWMLAALKEKGWRVVGSERTLDAARPAGGSTAGPLPVFVGTLDAVRPGRQFDAIVLFQVLEHLTAPMDVLNRCAALLKPGGTLIVGVPNARSWQAQLFGSDWFHLDVPRHLFHFSPRGLAWTLRTAGLDPAAPTFASLEHDPYGWVQSLLNRLGFTQNLLTSAIAGSSAARRSRLRLAAVFGLAALLTVPSVVAAMCSWLASAGAIMEMQAKKPA